MSDAQVIIETGLLEKLLAKISSSPGSHEIRICPQYSAGLQQANTTGTGFKLCKEGENPQRILNLILDRCTSDGSGPKTLESHLRAAIQTFWAEGNSDRVSTIFIAY